jgi:hypothetical protein
MVNLGIKEMVYDLLVRFPHLRDSDEKLCANIWYAKAARCATAMDFLQMYANGEIPNSESITRCRRKIQEENESLRGELYRERQAKQEDIKEQLGYPVPVPEPVAEISEKQLKINW